MSMFTKDALIAMLGIAVLTPPTLTIGDHGKDLDDEVACVIGSALHRLGFIDLLGTIANLDPSADRAAIAKGTYETLGLPGIPVAIGTNCNWVEKNRHAYQFDVPYAASQDRLVPDGLTLFRQVAPQLPDDSLNLVLMSGMTDALQLFNEERELFLSKVGRVTLMSGIELDGDGLPKLEDGFLVPNETANNTFDFPAAKKLYRLLQENAVPMTILTRDAAYAVATPPSFYDALGATNHPVGLRLRNAQREAVEQLWQQANLPKGHADRTLPWGPENNPRNREWFSNTFCGGDCEGRTGEDSIWDLICQFAQYDGLTVLASHPELCDKYFERAIVEVRGTDHYVIGLSKVENGVPDAPAVIELFEALAFYALGALDSEVPESVGAGTSST